MWNIWRDDQTVGFKVVHTVLAVVSVAFAVACLVVVSRVRRRRLDRERETTSVEADRTPVA
jgi:hypothetical protein